MGAALALLAAKEIPVERIVLAAPALSCPGIKPPKPLPVIYLYSLLRKRISTPWHHQSEYVLYYENAPADDDCDDCDDEEEEEETGHVGRQPGTRALLVEGEG